MKNLLFITPFLLLTLTLYSQKKVAVFDPKDESATDMGDIIREVFSTALTNSSEYVPVERVMIDQVLKENQYQLSGMVDDSEISELGKQMGADYVCVSIIKKMGMDFFITAKLVSVTTATVERQKYVKTANGDSDLFEKVEELSADLLSASLVANKETETSKVTKSDLPTIDLGYGTLIICRHDLPGTFTWQEANDACSNLNEHGFDDWILPNKTELNLLYKNKSTIGWFEDVWYWSSTESNISNAWKQYFGDGKQDDGNKTDDNHVRCVRRD